MIDSCGTLGHGGSYSLIPCPAPPKLPHELPPEFDYLAPLADHDFKLQTIPSLSYRLMSQRLLCVSAQPLI